MRLSIPRSRIGASVALFGVCAAALQLMSISPAQAHAIVERTEPRADEVVAASPEYVRMFFSEPVEIAFGAIRVYDTNATRVDTGDTEYLPGRLDAIEVRLDGELPRGTYTVTWRIISADSHPISEAFVWHVGSPGTHPQGIADELLRGGAKAGRLGGALFGVVRWVYFAALLAFMGALLFIALIWLRVNDAAVTKHREMHVRFGARWRLIVMWSWALLLAATAVSVVLQGGVAGGVSLADAASPGIVSEVLATRFGQVALVKLALLAASGALYAIVTRYKDVGVVSSRLVERPSVGSAGLQAAVPKWIFTAGAILIGGLAITPGLQGHAGTAPPVAVSLTADGLHLLALAAWIGGLVLLVGAAWPATRSLTNGDRVAALAPVVARFSNVAVVAVGVVVVTGTYQAFVEIGALGALTSTSYGWTFLAKMAVFLPLLGLGAVNNRRTKRSLERVVARGDAAHAPLGKLRRLVVAETMLAALVLAVTAGLVNLPPPGPAAATEGPLITDVRLGGANLEVLVDPNRVGANEVHLTATTPSGKPLAIKQMDVLFSLPSEELGPLEAKAHRLSPGHFVVHGNQLSVPGRWTLEVVARTDRFTEERATVEVTVDR